MTEHWITDVRPAFVDALQDHKMFVATHVHQYHHRNADTVQGLGGHPVTAGTHAQAFHVTLHVEHGEALGTDQVLIGMGQHAFDDLLFIHVQPIGLAQYGRQGRGAATEVGFLLHQVGEFALAYALDGLEYHRTTRQYGKWHLCSFTQTGQAKQKRQSDNAHVRCPPAGSEKRPPEGGLQATAITSRCWRWPASCFVGCPHRQLR
ncbi:hypothetical protein D3C79_755280 [compost metagenome]